MRSPTTVFPTQRPIGCLAALALVLGCSGAPTSSSPALGAGTRAQAGTPGQGGALGQGGSVGQAGAAAQPGAAGQAGLGGQAGAAGQSGSGGQSGLGQVGMGGGQGGPGGQGGMAGQAGAGGWGGVPPPLGGTGGAPMAGFGAGGVAGAGGPAAVLPACANTLAQAFSESVIGPTPRDSNRYQRPSLDELSKARALFDHALRGDFAGALPLAAAAGYSLCLVSGQGPAPGDTAVVLMQPSQKGQGRTTIAWRVGSARPLIVGAPHAWFESGTREVGLALFTRLSARALIVTGTHRCANAAASSCSGTTSVCGSSAPYRRSDMAHTLRSFYQVAHEALANGFAQAWVVSLHGMRREGVSLSNGTDAAARASSALAAIAPELRRSLLGERVTACNAGAGVPREPHLCGTTNTQGRHVNGSMDACTRAAAATSGRFVHIEQSRQVRGKLDALVSAFDAALPPP